MDEVIGHHLQVLGVPNLFIHVLALKPSQRVILFLEVAVNLVVELTSDIALSLHSLIRQVFATIDPVPDCSLYLQHDWNENLLDHL